MSYSDTNYMFDPSGIITRESMTRTLRAQISYDVSQANMYFNDVILNRDDVCIKICEVLQKSCLSKFSDCL